MNCLLHAFFCEREISLTRASCLLQVASSVCSAAGETGWAGDMMISSWIRLSECSDTPLVLLEVPATGSRRRRELAVFVGRSGVFMQRCLNRIVKSYSMCACTYVPKFIKRATAMTCASPDERHLGGLPRLGLGGQPSLKSQ